MGPDFVVVSTPILHFLPCVVKAQEPVRVQAFASELAVEGFDEAIVRGFAWSREIQHDTLLVSPDIEIARDKLRSLVDADRLGVSCAPRTGEGAATGARFNANRGFRNLASHEWNSSSIFAAFTRSPR